MKDFQWYMCRYCLEPFFSRDDILEHKRLTHDANNLEKDQVNKNLQAHENERSKNEEKVNNRDFKQITKESPSNSGGSRPHSQNHSRTITSIPSRSASSQASLSSSKINLFPNTKCKVTKSTIRNLTSSTRKMKLTKTSRTSTTKSSVNKSIAGKRLSEISPKTIISEPACYKCEKCGKEYSRHYGFRVSLKAHRIKQGLEYIFPCELCDKRLKKETRSNAQQKSLTRPKPKRATTTQTTFACQICEKSFPRKFSRDSHQKRHTLEFKYSCQICGKKFQQNYNLNIHVGSHLQPFHCEYCPKKYGFSNSLTRHMRTSHGIKH